MIIEIRIQRPMTPEEFQRLAFFGLSRYNRGEYTLLDTDGKCVGIRSSNLHTVQYVASRLLLSGVPYSTAHPTS